MICKNCGYEMPDDAVFCSHCGTKLVAETPEPAEKAAPAEAPKAPEVKKEAPAPKAEPETPRKPFMEEMRWDVSEYPDSNVIEKTDDIDFDWNADPTKIPDQAPKRPQPRVQQTPAQAHTAPTGTTP